MSYINILFFVILNIILFIVAKFILKGSMKNNKKIFILIISASIIMILLDFIKSYFVV